MSGPDSSFLLVHVPNAQCSGTTRTDLPSPQSFFPSSLLDRRWEVVLGRVLHTPLQEVMPYIADLAPMCPESNQA